MCKRHSQLLNNDDIFFKFKFKFSSRRTWAPWWTTPAGTPASDSPRREQQNSDSSAKQTLPKKNQKYLKFPLGQDVFHCVPPGWAASPEVGGRGRVGWASLRERKGWGDICIILHFGFDFSGVGEIWLLDNKCALWNHMCVKYFEKGSK